MANICREREFADWVHKFKIDKIPLTKQEWGWIRKGFFELYEMLRLKGLPK